MKTITRLNLDHRDQREKYFFLCYDEMSSDTHTRNTYNKIKEKYNSSCDYSDILVEIRLTIFLIVRDRIRAHFK